VALKVVVVVVVALKVLLLLLLAEGPTTLTSHLDPPACLGGHYCMILSAIAGSLEVGA
jgi:hypothetical protein